MSAVAPQTTQSQGQASDQQGLARGAIGLPGVLMQSITTVAPAIGMLFTIQFIASFAGVAAPLGYLLSFVLVLAIAACVSQLARQLPNSGVFFTYISRTVHPRVGWLTGHLMVLYMPAATFTSPIFLCVLLQQELDGSKLGWNIPWWLIFLAITGVVLTLPNSPGLVGQFHAAIKMGLSAYLPVAVVNSRGMAYAIVLHGVQTVWYIGAGILSLPALSRAGAHVSLADAVRESTHAAEAEVTGEPG